jgi:hypothetical protein
VQAQAAFACTNAQVDAHNVRGILPIFLLPWAVPLPTPLTDPFRIARMVFVEKRFHRFYPQRDPKQQKPNGSLKAATK